MNDDPSIWPADHTAVGAPPVVPSAPARLGGMPDLRDLPGVPGFGCLAELAQHSDLARHPLPGLKPPASTGQLIAEPAPPAVGRPRKILFIAWRDLANPRAGGSEVLVDRLAAGMLARGGRKSGV